MVYCKYTVRGACGPLPSLQLLLYALVVRGGLRAVDRRWEQAPIRASVQFHKHSAKPLWISSDTMEKLSNSKTCVYGQSLPRLHHGLDPPARDAQGIRSAPLPQHLGGGFSQVRSQTLKSIRVPLTLNLNLPPMPCGNAPVPEPPNPGMRGEILPSLRPRQPWKGAPSGSLRRGGTEGRH